jgi:AhpD family alkylhydroperoxidase
MDLKKVDPAFGPLSAFAKATSGTPKDIQALREKNIYRDGVFPAKVKTMLALLWSISEKCEPCIRYYAQKSKEYGATEEELGEFLAVASTMGGCVGEMWALKAFNAFKPEGDSGENCCV